MMLNPPAQEPLAACAGDRWRERFVVWPTQPYRWQRLSASEVGREKALLDAPLQHIGDHQEPVHLPKQIVVPTT